MRFRTAGMSGKVQRRVVLYSNDMEHNAIPLRISATIIPELEFAPSRFELTRSDVQHVPQISLVITNRSIHEVSLVSMRSTTPDLKPLEELPEKIEPGGKITVPFAIPLQKEGSSASLRSGYIIVEAKGAARSKSRIPVVFKNADS